MLSNLVIPRDAETAWPKGYWKEDWMVTMMVILMDYWREYRMATMMAYSRDHRMVMLMVCWREQWMETMLAYLRDHWMVTTMVVGLGCRLDLLMEPDLELAMDCLKEYWKEDWMATVTVTMTVPAMALHLVVGQDQLQPKRRQLIDKW